MYDEEPFVVEAKQERGVNLECEWTFVKGKKERRMPDFPECNSFKAKRLEKEEQLRQALHKNFEVLQKVYDEALYCSEPRHKRSETMKKEEKVGQKYLKARMQHEAQQKSLKAKTQRETAKMPRDSADGRKELECEKIRDEQLRQACQQNCEREQSCRVTQKEHSETEKKYRKAQQ